MQPPNVLGKSLSADLTADMIKQQGTFLLVTREDMTPQETVQKVNMGLSMLQAKTISMKRFRREYGKIRNPDKENLDVIGEQLYLNDEVIKQLIPAALAATGQDALVRLWEMTQNPMPPPGGSGSPPAGGPGQAPPGGPPPPPGGGPPTGMPPGMPMPMPPMGPMGGAAPLPPVMQGGNPFTNTQGPPLNAALAGMTGGAQGGGGMGGIPPPGGGGPMIRPMLPPGR
jgi:hypothetical protein